MAWAEERPKYYVSLKTGNKYPLYNSQYSIHPYGTKRYANLGGSDKEPECFDLPADEYPYTIEYEDGYPIEKKR